MNNCCFTGYLAENPLTSVVNNVVKTEIVVVSYTYRKSKSTGEKSRIPTYLHCEAWHTGAEILERHATKGSKISFNATARNLDRDDDQIIFRINEFDLCQEQFEE